MKHMIFYFLIYCHNVQCGVSGIGLPTAWDNTKVTWTIIKWYVSAISDTSDSTLVHKSYRCMREHVGDQLSRWNALFPPFIVHNIHCSCDGHLDLHCDQTSHRFRNSRFSVPLLIVISGASDQTYNNGQLSFRWLGSEVRVWFQPQQQEIWNVLEFCHTKWSMWTWNIHHLCLTRI